MEFQLLKQEKKFLNFNMFAYAFLFILMFLVNYEIEIKALVLDDLGIWNLFNTSTASDFILNMGSNKFRPVLNTVLYFLFKTCGTRIWLFTYANKLFNYMIAVMIYHIGKKMTNNFYGLFVAIMYIMSRFSYYSISQVYGIMESLALLLSIIALYFLYLFVIHKENRLRYFITANTLFTISVYVHERYIALFALSILSILLRPNKKKTIVKTLIEFGIAILLLIVNFLIRYNLFGTRALDGTGGIAIQESFDPIRIIKFFLEGWCYIFGFNTGPAYLNGIVYTDVAHYMTLLLFISTAIILFLFAKILISLLRKKFDNFQEVFSVCVLFCGYCALMILTASTTIRLELRWIYAPYTVFLMLVAYIAFHLDFKLKKSYAVVLVIILIFIGSYSDLYYRQHYWTLYYWPYQQFANSLQEETFGTYKAGIYSKEIYILRNDSAGFVSDEYYTAFFKPFSHESSTESVFCKVVDTEDLEDISERSNNYMVLSFDTTKGCYENVTDLFE